MAVTGLPPRPLKPSLVDCDEDCIEFSLLILPQLSYIAQFREIGEKCWTEKVLCTISGQEVNSELDEASEGAASAISSSDIGSHRLTGLKPKSTYEVRVFARRASGECSAPSEALTVDTQAKLGWLDRLLFHECGHVCQRGST